MKTSLSIHFSRTSHPPKFTPRRKGIVVAVAEMEILVEDVVEDEVEVELDFEVVMETKVEDGF